MKNKLLALLAVALIGAASCSREKEKEDLIGPVAPIPEKEVQYGYLNIELQELPQSITFRSIHIFKEDTCRVKESTTYYPDKDGKVSIKLAEGNYRAILPFRRGYNYVCHDYHSFKIKANETVEFKYALEVRRDTIK